MTIQSPRPKYDLHLSALAISRDQIRALIELGFCRDEFANNTRCVASEYHATYRGHRVLPNDELWSKTQEILLMDGGRHFRGGLEEEQLDRSCSLSTSDMPTETSSILRPLPITKVPAGKHKACDLHIGINLDISSVETVEELERLQVASFEKPTPEGTRRVYTITCEKMGDGRALFSYFLYYLSLLPSLYCTMKLERTTRFLRYPEDADVLPLTTSRDVDDWLSEDVLSENWLSY